MNSLLNSTGFFWIMLPGVIARLWRAASHAARSNVEAALALAKALAWMRLFFFAMRRERLLGGLG